MFNFKQSAFQENKIAFNWLKLSVLAIAISGIFSIFLVFLRTPILVNIFSKNIFKLSLIVHVNLSITVWMLTILCLINSITFTGIKQKLSSWPLLVATLGTILISISIFFGGEPSLNNYIPILENIVFIIGISLFLSGVLVSCLLSVLEFFCTKSRNAYNQNLSIVSFSTSIIYITAIMCFYLTTSQLNNRILNYENSHYYELVFWAFGHIVQYVFIQLLIFSWFILAQAHLGSQIISQMSWNKIFYINPIICIVCPLFFIFASVESGAYIEFFTMHMKYFGGISASISATIILYHLYKIKSKKLDYKIYCFIFSLLIFAIGGLIGYLISGTNVTVPAHYHGSIVGITIALMGLIYYIIAQLGYKLLPNKILTIQLFLYCLGQAIHIIGLALSGGYGAMRKVAGVELSATAKFYMGLMGLGGIIAIISGIIFIVSCYLAIKNGRKNESE
jgi:cytochrome c oxidase subunit 1